MQLASASTPRQQINRKDIRRANSVVLGAIIAIVLFSLLSPVLARVTLDGTTYRAGILVEDHWGNVRNPEISFSDGWYYWATGSDQVLAGSYACIADRIVTQDGWTSQLSFGGTALTLNGTMDRRVLLNLNNLR